MNIKNITINGGVNQSKAFKTLSNLNDHEADLVRENLEKVCYKVIGIEAQIDFQRNMRNDLNIKWANGSPLIVDPGSLNVEEMFFWVLKGELHVSHSEWYPHLGVSRDRELITY